MGFSNVGDKDCLKFRNFEPLIQNVWLYYRVFNDFT